MKDITQMVFQQSRDGLLKNGSQLDISLLNILWAMDGQRSVADIAKEDAYDLNDLAAKVQGLLDMSLIEAATGANKILDAKTVDTIYKQMAHYAGPVAEILVENCANALGHPPSAFPVHQLEKLLNLLSQDLQDEKEAEAFKQSVLNVLK